MVGGDSSEGLLLSLMRVRLVFPSSCGKLGDTQQEG